MASMDVLKALDDLKAAGVEERSARAMIRLVSDAVELQAATRSDLERECGKLRATLSSEIADFRAGTGAEFAAVRSEMAEFRGDTGTEFAAVRGDTDAGFAALRREMAEFRSDTDGKFAAIRSELAEFRTSVQQDFKSLRAEVAQDISGLRIELLKEMGAIRDNLNVRLLTVVGLQFGGTALLLGGFYALLRP